MRVASSSRCFSSSLRLHPRLVRPAAPCRAAVLRVRAALAAKGRALDAEALAVKRSLGQGSYGEVFEGVLSTLTGDERVVLKRVRSRVEVREVECPAALCSSFIKRPA